MATFEPIGAFDGAGAVSYSPQLDESKRFGAWEVHPNKTPVTANGSVSLEWNGEYLAVGFLSTDDGSNVPYSLGCRGVMPNVTARQAAEMVCALRNNDKPTRVVDACGIESISAYTASSLYALGAV